MTSGSTSRPINEITGIKKRSSVLVRGLSHMEIAKLIGAIPQWYTEVEYVEWAKGPRGFSTFELWQMEPGNENMTLEDFFNWLGFVEATQEAAIIAQIDAAAAASAASATLSQRWANELPGPVSGGEYSSKKYANDANTAKIAAEAAQAAAEAAAAGVVGGSLASGAIFGLQTNRNGANPNTRIDIGVGQARSSDNIADIILAAAITKRLDAVWAAGTNNGGRDVATALAAGQSWHVFLIWHPTGPTVDALFSLSPTAPTLPGGYTKFRRIWSLPPLGADNIPPSGTNIPGYVQIGNICKLAKRTSDFTGQTGNTAPQLKNFIVPVGIKLEVEFYSQMAGDGNTIFLRTTDPDLGVPAAFGGSDQWGHIRLSGSELYLTAVFWQTINTAGQAYVHCSHTAGVWAIGVLGWKDQRGQIY